jgi:hypothetical protein
MKTTTGDMTLTFEGSSDSFELAFSKQGQPDVRQSFSFGADSLEVSFVAGFMGPAGPAGSAASISTQQNNRLTLGNDGGMYVPQLEVDPVAYYILSKG